MQRLRLARDVWLAPTGERKKGNAHTTEYENDTPVGWQGFIICLRNAARYFTKVRKNG